MICSVLDGQSFASAKLLPGMDRHRHVLPLDHPLNSRRNLDYAPGHQVLVLSAFALDPWRYGRISIEFLWW